VISFQSRVREIQSLLSENESQLLPLQYELNTVKREKDLFQNRNHFLEAELEKKSTEFYQTKRDHLSALQELELQLAQKNNECGEYQEKIKQFEVSLPLPLPPSPH
jgi:chromosome segregation ATPase